MKRRLRRLIVFAGVLGLVMALNVGAAFAHPGGAEDAFTANGLAASGPVLNNISATGMVTGNFAAVIANNPLCPGHPVGHA